MQYEPQNDVFATDKKIPSALLTVSIVVYRPDIRILKETLLSLSNAVVDLSHCHVFLIDNTPEPSDWNWLDKEAFSFKIDIIVGHGNIGYGRANNIVLGSVGTFHLVLNPDVILDPASIENALIFMYNNPECGLISPFALDPNGNRQYLCKRYPPLFDLLLRGLAPTFVQDMFSERLKIYEMRDQISTAVYWDPPIVSGCFMFFRGRVFESVGGFNNRYFLYFEDFDLSIRTAQVTRITYVPAVQIIHCGGSAASKGLGHIMRFFHSAVLFYSTFGLKLF